LSSGKKAVYINNISHLQHNATGAGTIDGADPIQVSYKEGGNLNMSFDREYKQLWSHAHSICHLNNINFTGEYND
jgi:hypothetical protein